jgi:hypothetical protein
MLLLVILFLVLPFIVFGAVAWRFGSDSRDWRRSGEWDWLQQHPLSDGAGKHD